MIHWFGAFWGAILFWIPNRARDTTVKNISVCFPEMERKELDALIRNSLKNTCCTALEMGKAWMLPANRTLALVKESEGLEEFRQALDSGDGVIMLAPHLGNWEIFGIFIAENVDTTFMYQPPKIAAFDRLLKQVRVRNGINLAPTNRKGVALILSALMKGKMVGVLPDQVPADNSGLYAPFFGNDAFTMTLVSKLVKRSKARVFCGFTQRLPHGRGFKTILKEAHAAIYSDNLSESVEGLNKTVEASVEEAIEQYQWEYKRYRRQEDGSKFY